MAAKKKRASKRGQDTSKRDPKIEKEIAEWMLAKFNERKSNLYQSEVVAKVMRDFGREFLYQNRRGRWAFGKGILGEFRKLTPDPTIVWSRSRQMWRTRTKWDKGSGRMVR